MWSKVLLNNKMICIRLFFSNVLMVKFNVGLWFNHRKYFRISTGAICSEFPQELFGQNFPRSYLVRISTGAIWSEFPQELFGHKDFYIFYPEFPNRYWQYSNVYTETLNVRIKLMFGYTWQTKIDSPVLNI
jgi:hypothetical protein